MFVSVGRVVWQPYHNVFDLNALWKNTTGDGELMKTESKDLGDTHEGQNIRDLAEVLYDSHHPEAPAVICSVLVFVTLLSCLQGGTLHYYGATSRDVGGQTRASLSTKRVLDLRSPFEEMGEHLTAALVFACQHRLLFEAGFAPP